MVSSQPYNAKLTDSKAVPYTYSSGTSDLSASASECCTFSHIETENMVTSITS